MKYKKKKKETLSSKGRRQGNISQIIKCKNERKKEKKTERKIKYEENEALRTKGRETRKDQPNNKIFFKNTKKEN